MERWVCLRCYESNDGALLACPKCGLARGTTPGPDEEGVTAVWASRPPQPNMLLGLVRRFGWLILVVVITVVGYWFSASRGDSGQITRGGNLGISDLRAGDCFDLKDQEAVEVQEVDAKVCTEPHQFEMMFIGDMRDGPYPDDAAMDDYTVANCDPVFDAYVGRAYEDSQYDWVSFSPTEAGWKDGDHAMQCALIDPDNDKLTGSLLGVAR
jgi:hypothetical protein